jgi:hypothetical protein
LEKYQIWKNIKFGKIQNLEKISNLDIDIKFGQKYQIWQCSKIERKNFSCQTGTIGKKMHQQIKIVMSRNLKKEEEWVFLDQVATLSHLVKSRHWNFFQRAGGKVLYSPQELLYHPLELLYRPLEPGASGKVVLFHLPGPRKRACKEETSTYLSLSWFDDGWLV